MEIRGQLRALHYFRKLVSGDTQNILPFNAVPLKPFMATKKSVPLQKCTPEKAGVNSADISNYLKKLNNRKGANVHSVLIVKDQKKICDASFAPYSTDDFHITHSLCKTITSFAIGMLIDDGLLSYDDKICDIFPENCNFLTSRRMRNVSVQHLLSMTSGANFKEVSCVVEKDWVSSFISYDVSSEPGAKFEYNSMNSYMLSAIVTKLTGEKLQNYLAPRLFEPLGFGSIHWESCPMGNDKGGWGMYILPEDAAKIGLLILQKGKFMQNGDPVQILSEDYLNKAVKPYGSFAQNQDYGFQIWVMDKGQFYVMNGLFGQNVFIYPKLSMVIVINAGGPSLSVAGPIYNITKMFLNTVQNSNFTFKTNFTPQNFLKGLEIKNLKYNTILDKKLTNSPSFLPLTLKKRLKANNDVAENCRALHNTVYEFTKCRFGLFPIILSCMNDFYTTGLSSISFFFNEQTYMFYLNWMEGASTLRIPIGFDKPEMCTLNFGGNIFKTAVCGRFTTDEDDNPVLKVSMHFTESSGVQNIKFYFNDNKIKIVLRESPDFINIIENLRVSYPFTMGKDLISFYQNEYAQKILQRLCDITIYGTKQEFEYPINNELLNYETID